MTPDALPHHAQSIQAWAEAVFAHTKQPSPPEREPKAGPALPAPLEPIANLPS